ncbi:MAG: hypothetical protein RI953_866 [Pseudomonadota bacterium]|jgi:hypothetical protein
MGDYCSIDGDFLVDPCVARYVNFDRYAKMPIDRFRLSWEKAERRIVAERTSIVGQREELTEFQLR